MTGNSRLLTLDAVRGLAAVCVVMVHLGLEYDKAELARFGHLGVDLFFVMSGFVISRAYDHKLLAGLSWQRFMLLRVARLYPSMFLGLLVGLAAYLVIPPSAYPIGLIPGGTYELGWRSIGHFFLVPDLGAREGIFPLNGVFWSLFFELVINLVHGLTVRRLTIFRLSVFVVAIGIWWAFTAATAGKWGFGGGWNGPSFMGGFLRVAWAYGAGMLLHRVMAHHWRAPAIVPVALTGLIMLVPNFGLMLPRIVISLFVLCPLIVLLAAGAEVPPRARRVAAWIGAISYPLYATHHPLMLMIVYRLEPAGVPGMTAAVVAVILFATIVEYAYDAPVRKRLIAWATPLTSTPVTPAPELPRRMPL
jgi:peptidoglycan/LPS O-acetylase OafA/YrhL